MLLMRMINPLIFLMLLSFVTAAQAQSTKYRWQLLVPGEYHDGEAPINPGSGWLALTVIGGAWHLEPTVVRAKRVQDGLLDAENQKTGISISSSKQTRVLLRIPGLKAGKIDTPNLKFKDNARFLAIDDKALKIFFKGQEHLIFATMTGVYLEQGKQKMLLSDRVVDGEDTASLIWAGDIDGDGQLDLLMEYGGSNSGQTCVYLSSKAKQVKLLEKVACFHATGC